MIEFVHSQLSNHKPQWLQLQIIIATKQMLAFANALTKTWQNWISLKLYATECFQPSYVTQKDNSKSKSIARRSLSFSQNWSSQNNKTNCILDKQLMQ
jgi:hypothetical protein